MIEVANGPRPRMNGTKPARPRTVTPIARSNDEGAMYATCLFCNKALGSNETLESFPVGKRLAFDAAKGRLWVVCPHCERWNLSPLEERWEAIEQAEKLYRDTRRRVATDNIGLAKLRDGTTLVRIGEPLRPEFAAWRYGDQFGRRRRRQMLIVGGGVAALGAVVSAGAVAGVGIGGFGWLLARVRRQPSSAAIRRRSSPKFAPTRAVWCRCAAATSPRRRSREADDGSLAINLRFKHGKATFVGREAERIASIVIPKVNRFGGDKEAVADAVREIERRGGTEGYLARLAKLGDAYSLRPGAIEGGRWRRRLVDIANTDEKGLFGAAARNIASRLEMALHEEAERRAIEGELAELERAWRDAEEIAGIADSLLLPDDVNASMERMRKDTEREK